MDSLNNLLEFPYSALLALLFLLAVAVVHRCWGGSGIIRRIASVKTARILIASGAVMLALEGTFSWNIHQSSPFAIYILALLTTLLLTVLDAIAHKAKVGFILNHLGLFLIVWAAFFGSPDVQRVKMIVGSEQPENVAHTSDGTMQLLPFGVKLESFHIEYYDDGKSPRQFTSELEVDGHRMATAVNAPCSYNGYTIYQNGYKNSPPDTPSGDWGAVTILELVKDPWLPIVYTGMILLAIGSVLLLFGKWRKRIIIPATLLLTILFTALTIAKINLGTMMPALRSWWFVPHIFIYMVAYSLMALALVGSIVKRWRCSMIPEQLVRSSSALLIIGMLTGSVWARQAWGDYWAWDPKENWAAVTWFVSLIYLHMKNKHSVKALTIVIIAFLALQITWYGVNYLPSAMNSLHNYTS